MITRDTITRVRRALIIPLLLLPLIIFSQATPAGAAPGDCIGTVYRDYNGNGQRDLRANGATVGGTTDLATDDPGQAGIIVTAYDDNNAVVGTAITDANGLYDLNLSVPAGTPIRVEFTWTEAWLQSAPLGESSVQFGEVGACDFEFGVMNPADYCQNNPFLATSCYESGPHQTSSGPALTATRYDWGVDGNIPAGSDTTFSHQDAAGAPAPPVNIADNSEIGTTWGQAWNGTTGNVLLGAYLKLSLIHI